MGTLSASMYALYFSPTFFNIILICGGATKYILKKKLIFTSVILLSQSSAACENKLSFIRMHTQIFMFDYLISSPPHKKKTNNPET